MASLIGKVIAGWKLQDVVKCTPQVSIYRVCLHNDENTKFCMSILYKDSDNPDYHPDNMDDPLFDINVNIRPEFVYYDCHCFPIIPTENACGEYNGHEFFVYERVSKPLDNVVTKNTHVSRDDFLNIAIQIFKILQYLFDKNRILKNIDIRDFCLRRTTNGYRVILINQDFYTGQPFDIDDPTFTSVSVMKGNEPTMRDNVISCVYIMLYLCNSSLPWLADSSVDTILSKKMDDVLIESLVDEEYSIFLSLLKKYNLHSTQALSLDDVIMELRANTVSHNITFGNVLSKYANKRRIPSITGTDYYANPVIENSIIEKEEEVKRDEDIIEEEEVDQAIDQEGVKEEETKGDEVDQEVRSGEMEEEVEIEEKQEEVKKEEEEVEIEEKQDQVMKEEEEIEIEEKEEEVTKEEKQEEVEIEEKQNEKSETQLLPTFNLSEMELPKKPTEKREQPSCDIPITIKKPRIHTLSKRSIKHESKRFFASATFSNILMVTSATVASMMGM